MVSLLAWVSVALMVSVALAQLVVALLSQRRSRRTAPPPEDRLARDVLVKLYGIRQRLAVRQYRTVVKREGAKARRTLADELRRWEEWE